MNHDINFNFYVYLCCVCMQAYTHGMTCVKARVAAASWD